ncbi:MAG: Aegerolysin [Bacteroidetes bacterium]|nr:MAG: Aegerolysin [Bacteroidota bacterium]
MAYAQWIQANLNPSNFANSLHIGNAQLSWGKFYSGSKSTSVSAGTIDKTVVANNASGSVFSCGRESASAGTVGSFDVFDGKAQTNNSNRVCTFSWSCPWGSPTNTWGISNKNHAYMTSTSGGSTNGGAIGMVKIDLYRKA